MRYLPGRRRIRLTLDITAIQRDRILFLQGITGTEGPEEVVRRALRYYDRAVCAVAEGATIVARHRDGSVEYLRPEREMDALAG